MCWDLQQQTPCDGHVFVEAAQEAGFRPRKWKAGLLQRCADTDGLPRRASFDRPADVWTLDGQDTVPTV